VPVYSPTNVRRQLKVRFKVVLLISRSELAMHATDATFELVCMGVGNASSGRCAALMTSFRPGREHPRVPHGDRKPRVSIGCTEECRRVVSSARANKLVRLLIGVALLNRGHIDKVHVSPSLSPSVDGVIGRRRVRYCISA
jgi:hypothetical protein